MDWFPTIADLCGVDLPKVKLDGKSLVPIIESESAESHNKVMHWQWGDRWAVREGEWKLVGNLLGNLNDAQPERKNYIKEKPEIAKRLRILHNEWVKEVQ